MTYCIHLLKIIMYLKFVSTNDELTSAVNQKEYLRAKYHLQLTSLRVAARRKMLRTFAAVKALLYVHISLY